MYNNNKLVINSRANCMRIRSFSLNFDFIVDGAVNYGIFQRLQYHVKSQTKQYFTFMCIHTHTDIISNKKILIQEI